LGLFNGDEAIPRAILLLRDVGLAVDDLECGLEIARCFDNRRTGMIPTVPLGDMPAAWIL
jgi:hypothetical protein